MILMMILMVVMAMMMVTKDELWGEVACPGENNKRSEIRNLDKIGDGGHNDDGDGVGDDDDDDDDDDDKGVESKEPWASCGKFKMCCMLLQRFHFPAMKRIMMMMRRKIMMMMLVELLLMRMLTVPIIVVIVMVVIQGNVHHTLFI